MTTRADFIEDAKRLTPVLRDQDEDTVDTWLDNALRAYSQHRPLKILYKGIARTNDGVYDEPEGAIRIITAYVHETRTEIRINRYNTPEGEKKYSLGRVHIPSWHDIAEVGYYESPQQTNSYRNYGAYVNTIANLDGVGSVGSYDEHDLEYTKLMTIEQIDPNQVQNIHLYLQYEGYLAKAGETEELVDITDREPSGAATTIRNSQRFEFYSNLAMKAKEEFDREVPIPYATRTALPSLSIIRRIHLAITKGKVMQEEVFQFLSPMIMPTIAIIVIVVQAVGGFIWMKSRIKQHDEGIEDNKKAIDSAVDRIKAIELTRPDRLEELFNIQTEALRESIQTLGNSFEHRTEKLEDYFIKHIENHH